MTRQKLFFLILSLLLETTNHLIFNQTNVSFKTDPRGGGWVVAGLYKIIVFQFSSLFIHKPNFTPSTKSSSQRCLAELIGRQQTQAGSEPGQPPTNYNESVPGAAGSLRRPAARCCMLATRRLSHLRRLSLSLNAGKRLKQEFTGMSINLELTKRKVDPDVILNIDEENTF